jgi:hypothetical protein
MRLIKDLLDRIVDRFRHVPESVLIIVLDNYGRSNYLDVYEILKRLQWGTRRPETVKKHLDRMVSEGKIRSERGKNFTYYGVLKNDETR